jgi:nitroreductase
MKLQAAIKERKSVRGYLDKPVPKDVLNQILEISIRAPSTKNTQPWHLYRKPGYHLFRRT